MVLIAMAIVSCNRDVATMETLTHAEAIMQEHPDSALSLLQAIDTKTISTDRCRALHALLLSQAYDKNYIDLTCDSLISIAVNYYNEHGTAKEKFLSLYYLGRVHYNAKNYAKAILAFSKAEQLISEFDDDFIKGLLYTQLGFIYEQYYDSQKALNAYQQSYFYYDKANKPIHRSFAKYDEATIYMEIPQLHEKAIEIHNETIKEAIERKDSTLISICLGNLILLHIEQGQFEQANILSDSLLNNFSIGIHNSNLFSALSFLCAYIGNYKQSNQYMKIANAKAKSNSDSVMTSYYVAKIAALKKDYNVAYENLYNAKIIENRAIRKRLDHPILTIQKEYLEKELELNKLKQQHQLHTSILVGILVVTIALTIIIYMRYVIRRREYKISEYSDIIMELSQKQQEEKNIVSELLQNSFKDQFKYLNSIGDTIFDKQDDTKGLKIVYNDIKYIVERFKERKTYQELELLVNKYCDNVMDKLRTGIPNLNEEDYRQLCYHYAGFSGKLISILLEKNQSNIYIRKSRLKEKIKQLNVPDGDMILRHLP